MGKEKIFETKIRDIIKEHLGLRSNVLIQKAKIEVGVDEIPSLIVEVIIVDKEKC